jgi:hypothetical protein
MPNPEKRKALFTKQKGKGTTDIAHADDADGGCAGLQFIPEFSSAVDSGQYHRSSPISPERKNVS